MTPILDAEGKVQQVVAVVWDASTGRRLQQKIDAIDAAGRELVRLESESISRLNVAERLRLLEDKIIRYTRDLMHFDHFIIRLLNRKNNKLEPVISVGLPPEALEVDLYAQPEGNGISGYVAVTGRSYICNDVEKDARYIIGLDHAYHGHSPSLIEISPYKCEGPGGEGLADHASKVPMPDTYRGPYRGPDAGPKYAKEVADAIAEIEASGTQFAESRAARIRRAWPVPFD